MSQNQVFHFEKEKENDDLKVKLKELETSMLEQKQENEKLRKEQNYEMAKETVKVQGNINNLEQYSRRNNIRISGVFDKGEESQSETTNIVVQVLNENIDDLNLERDDIDVAHRLGKIRPGERRNIIVKFVSRLTRDKVMRSRRVFKGSNIFLNEDMTKINNKVLACLRKKMPSAVEQAWIHKGSLFYKSKSNTVHPVPYQEFQYWLDLDWPKADIPINAPMETQDDTETDTESA